MHASSVLANRELNREPDEFFQRELPLLGRIDGPSVAPAALVRAAVNYRDAVRLCWAYRRVKRMTARALAEHTGMYPSHVSEYLSNDDTKREMPARYIAAFEATTGNTLVSQWIARNAQLTVAEEAIADRRAA